MLPLHAPAAGASPSGDLGEITVRLSVAVVVGATIGFNREMRDKPAGLRTHSLVSLGAALLTVTSVLLATTANGVDASVVSRAIQGTITGIGFLGGGVILRDDSRQIVHGLTTAASIWVASALGVACGAGYWQTALVALGLTLVVLVVGAPVAAVARRALTPIGRIRG